MVVSSPGHCKIEANERRPSKQIAERLADCLAIAPEHRPTFLHFARATPRAAQPVLPILSYQAPRGSTDLPTALPAQLTPSIGRDRELAALRERLLSAFLDEGLCVALASSGEPEALVTTIAQTLGVEESNDQPIYAALIVFPHGKQVLLLLDTFEQLSDAAPLVVELLTSPQG